VGKSPPFSEIGVIWGVRAIALIAVLLVWQFGSGKLFNRYYLGTPIDIYEQLVEWGRSGYLLSHVLATAKTTILGFTFAAVAGITFAVGVASNDWVARILAPFVYAGFSLPKVILAPLMVFWLGVGFLPCLAMSALTAFFFVFFNAYHGIRNVSPALINAVQLLGPSRLQLLFKVQLPSAAPMIAQGLHQGIVYAFHGTIVGEMTASSAGIGYLLILASSAMDTTGVLAGLVVLAAITLVLTRVTHLVMEALPSGGEVR
jgi:NitT/TauT family transport system permease protein